ncbi:Transcription factor GRAS [Macleaya cordata]|uniref:Transcription factor GRAS n=1 Tax=Macleaya cordata TaxID=56857 RepID=A0A200QZY2_MACCD|nr:Transcription factor GRAS [Macleaya cordata]
MSSQLRSESGFSRKDYQYYSGFPVTGLSQLVGYSSMQASQKQGGSGGSHSLYYQELESNCLPQNIRTLDEHHFTDESSQGVHYPSQTSNEQYCTLESSSATGGCTVYNTPSTVSFSPNGSPLSQQESHTYPPEPNHSPYDTYGSPISLSCITDNENDMWNKLKELETAMLGPDSDIMDSSDSTFQDGLNLDQSSLETESWNQMMEMMPRRDLKEVLISCAKAVSDNDLITANQLIGELRNMVSVSGEPIQRLGAYMLEGLVARLASTGSCIYKALRCKEPASAELLSYMHILYEVCPYFKFGYMSANGAIAEAVKDEHRIHIIDFQIAQGSQWITLMQALAARPGGPPFIRITGIDDSNSAYARGGGLQIVGQRLSRLAENCKIPFEFNAAAVSGVDVELSSLGVRPGEAIAVNFAYVLHHMPDESVSTQNHRDRLLRLIKSLSPKVVTLVEQESNTNTAPFFPRFLETLSYYTAMFESIDVTLPRDHKERINIEQHCLARDVVNIIACEGAERVERHEVLGKWKARFTMAGFTPYPLSSVVNSTIKTLLENYCEKYRLEERDGALYLGWMDRNLVASCAWR